MSRAHPEAWNILMTVLDDGQRYVRVDESPDAEVIKVAPGVSFLATANIGVEYTSTRVIDRAIQDRFLILEMDLLDKNQQGKLINYVCPNLNEQTVDILTSIYTQVYNEVLSGHGKVSTTISTRTILRAAALICDGFTIGEALEVCVFPYFTEEGGADSERTYVRQIVQKFIPIDSLDNDNMFDEGDTANK
jgi:nitric oxide reductase NorQ protein